MPYPVRDRYEFVRCNRDCPHAVKAERVTDPWWVSPVTLFAMYALGAVSGAGVVLTAVGWGM